MSAPAIRVVLRSASLSDFGGRMVQEDASLADDALGLYAVADGMGASMSGRPAADLAIATLQHAHATRDPGGAGLAAAVTVANTAICERTLDARRYWTDPNRPPRADSHELTRWLGLGSTIVALRIGEGAATIAHVGDSRAYRWRGGRLERLTIDHRLVDEARSAGMAEDKLAELPPKIITRALGFSEDLTVDTNIVDTRPGDVFLLTSDGLTDELADLTIAALMRDHAGDLAAIARHLVERAVGASEAALCDNVTAVLIAVEDALV